MCYSYDYLCHKAVDVSSQWLQFLNSISMSIVPLSNSLFLSPPFKTSLKPTVLNSSASFRRSSSSQLSDASSSLKISKASEVVRDFYNGINRRDIESVELLIAKDCVYEDLVFSKPFVGRKEILDFFKNFSDSISKDLQFVIDDISNEDTSAVGVTWHLEWKGRHFPFSKGCSFYRMEIREGRKQITYGRDCVEPATKPGETALIIIRGVTWLLQKFPQLADRL